MTQPLTAAEQRARDRYLGFLGKGPKRIPQWESLYCPEAISGITGIDYFAAPRSCLRRFQELYPRLPVGVPEADAPLPRPGESAVTDSAGHGHVRWGAAETWRFDWGHDFADAEEVLRYRPLEQLDLSQKQMPEARDYSDEARLFREYRSRFPAEWGDRAPPGCDGMVGFYNTLIIWPILVFGYERFLEACLEPEFGRVMADFAEISSRVMRVFARLPVHFVSLHDDIVTTRGPLISPAWFETHIFPRYAEWWAMLREAGKHVLFVTDGCADVFAERILECGARGIRTEPYTNFKAIARRHPDAFLAGEGDVRVLLRNDAGEIRRMVEAMVETGRMCGGYFLSIGNLIPHNISADALRRYLDLCEELGWR